VIETYISMLASYTSEVELSSLFFLLSPSVTCPLKIGLGITRAYPVTGGLLVHPPSSADIKELPGQPMGLGGG
jgi:hypothetical protein